jgi:hypothetical protein
VNNELERIRKEAVIAKSRQDPVIYLKGLRKTKKIANRHSRCSGRDSNTAFPQYKSTASTIYHPVWLLSAVDSYRFVSFQ